MTLCHWACTSFSFTSCSPWSPGLCATALVGGSGMAARHLEIGRLVTRPRASGDDETETRGTRFGEDEIGDVDAELESGHVVDPRVDATVDPAQARLGCGRAVAVEVPDDPRQHVGRDADGIAVSEEVREHCGAGPADRAVRSGIRRVRGRAEQWGPRRVAGGGRRAEAAFANSGDGPPDQEVVLGVVEGDRGVGERKGEQRKQLGGTREVGVVGERGLLSDLVPRDPDGARPEPGDYGLVGRTGGARFLAEGRDLVESLAVYG